MTTYQKQEFTGGVWVDKSKLKTGMRAKIVSETNPEPSKWKDDDGNFKTQDVCRVKFEGLNDIVKTSLNRVTINALVDAFGTDSKSWMNKTLTVDIRKLDGKVYLYLVPQGYRRTEDTEGYTIIVKDEAPSDVITEADLPF